ncbi:MAG: hypothetical protein ABI564_11960 [Ideonella sp.]
MTSSEARLIGWVGVFIALAALVAALLLPGSQSWLCRHGARFACVGKTEIKSLTFRHQAIPRSADATILFDVLASKLSFNEEGPSPVMCDEVEDLLALHEHQYVEARHAGGLRRGLDDFVMADIAIAYPSSDTPLTIDVEVTLRTPKLENGIAAFGLGAGPVKQRVSLQSPAGAGDCKASFLIGLHEGRDGLATAGWPPGSYTADVDVRGGADAHDRVTFALPP